MSTVTITFEAKGERGRGESGDYSDDAGDNFYGTDSPGQGRTITGSIVGKRGQTIKFTRHPGGNRGLNVFWNSSTSRYESRSGGLHGGDGGGAAALTHNDKDIVIAGGGGGRGGRYGNAGGNAGSYRITVQGGTYYGGQDGGPSNERRGRGGLNGIYVGTGGSKYSGGSASWDGNTGGNGIDIYQGGHGGSGSGDHSDGGGGGGAGWAGGGGGGGHGEDSQGDAGSNNSGGGGGGDSMIHTTSTDDVYVSGTPTESLNTDTTAQVEITYLSQTVTLNSTGDEFTFSQATDFSNVSLGYTKTDARSNYTIVNFIEDTSKTYTYKMSQKGQNNYIYDTASPISGSNINNVYINSLNELQWTRPDTSATAYIEFDVEATAVVTGITQTSYFAVDITYYNRAPRVNDITESVHWNSTNNTFDFSGNDADGDSLTYVISSSSSGPFGQNSLSLPGGTVTLDLTYKKFIIDSSNNTTIIFYYAAIDGRFGSNQGTVTITKSNENAPTASNIVKFTHTDAVTIYLFGSDGDSDSVSFSLGTTTTNFGTWSSITGAGGNEITYTPSGNQLGVDTADYSISDLVDSSDYTITVYSGLTNIKDGGQDLTELYKRKHDNTSGYIALTNNKSNYQVNGTDLVNIFERENGTGTSTSNLKVTVADGTTYPLDRIFKRQPFFLP